MRDLQWRVAMVGFFPSLLGARCLGCAELLYQPGPCVHCARLESDRRMDALMEPPRWRELSVQNIAQPVPLLSLGPYENLWRQRITAAKGWPAASTCDHWCDQWLAQVPAQWRQAHWVAVPPRPLQGFHLVEELASVLRTKGVAAPRGLLAWRWRAALGSSRQKKGSRKTRLAAQGRFRARRSSAEARPLVLFDDVTTSGATLREAAEVLTSQGWAIVGAAVLAHTPLHDRRRERTE